MTHTPPRTPSLFFLCVVWGGGTPGPLGPCFVTADEIPNPQVLRCSTKVNGEVRQDSNTADMIFTVAECIAWLSTEMTLAPGTVILTGTPEGVGAGKTPPIWLVAGDKVECAIEGIGAITNRVAKAPGAK